jgi:hypothetical protein
MTYSLCDSCRCHVRSQELRCPFCGVEVPSKDAPVGPRSNRVGRAWWLACQGSTLVLFACGGTRAAIERSDPSTAPSDAAPAVDSAPLGAWLTSGTGTFPCNGAVEQDGGLLACDRATQWCYTFHGADPTACASLGDPCYVNPGDDACAPTGDGRETVLAWDPSACDGGLRRCDCLSVQCVTGFCSDDDAGGITVSCGSCYGAPPARIATRRAPGSPRFRGADPPVARGRNRPTRSARTRPLSPVLG